MNDNMKRIEEMFNVTLGTIERLLAGEPETRLPQSNNDPRIVLENEINAMILYVGLAKPTLTPEQEQRMNSILDRTSIKPRSEGVPLPISKHHCPECKEVRSCCYYVEGFVRCKTCNYKFSTTFNYDEEEI